MRKLNTCIEYLTLSLRDITFFAIIDSNNVQLTFLYMSQLLHLYL